MGPAAPTPEAPLRGAFPGLRGPPDPKRALLTEDAGENESQRLTRAPHDDGFLLEDPALRKAEHRGEIVEQQRFPASLHQAHGP
jgi:hypothetical protein